MRRWARTRFMPDDCGLKPPIEALPQIAQERAMRVLRSVVRWSARAGRPERGGMIAHGPGRSSQAVAGADMRSSSARPRHPQGGPSPRGHPSDTRPIPRHPSRHRRHRPRRDPRLVRRQRVRRRPARAARSRRLGLASPGLTIRLDDGIEIELDLTVALGVPVAEVARQVDFGGPLRPPPRARPGGRPARHPRRRPARPADGAAAVAAGRRRRPAIRPRDLADSGTDVA